jgi:hypothetical protein
MLSSPCRWSRSRAEDLAEFGGPIKHTQGLEVWSSPVRQVALVHRAIAAVGYLRSATYARKF